MVSMPMFMQGGHVPTGAANMIHSSCFPSTITARFASKCSGLLCLAVCLAPLVGMAVCLDLLKCLAVCLTPLLEMLRLCACLLWG